MDKRQVDCKWMSVLNDVPLTREEKKRIDDFVQTKKASSILPAYHLLKSKEFLSEAIELLSFGLNLFPKHLTLRVTLAKEIFHRGLVKEALKYLAPFIYELRQNALAMELCFKSYILLELEKQTSECFQSMEKEGVISASIQDLVGVYKNQGFSAAHDYLRKLLQIDGVGQIFAIPESAKPSFQPTASESMREIRKLNYCTVPLGFVFDRGRLPKPGFVDQQSRLLSIECKIEFLSQMLAKLKEEQFVYEKPTTKNSKIAYSQWSQLRSLG